MNGWRRNNGGNKTNRNHTRTLEVITMIEKILVFGILILSIVAFVNTVKADQHKHITELICIENGYDTEQGFKEDENCTMSKCLICGVIQNFSFCSWQSEEKPDEKN
jgi:hypothetical protein